MGIKTARTANANSTATVNANETVLPGSETSADQLSRDSVVDLRDDVRVVRSWGHTAGSAARVQGARDLAELREMLRRAGERGLIPRGGGHSLGDAARCGGGSVVRLRRPLVAPAVTGINWETKRATVRIGSRIADITEELLLQGWFIPTGAMTAQSTFASALAANGLGPSGTVDGHAHASVQSLVAMTANGELATWSRTGEPDSMFSAFVGGQGLVGIGLSAEVEITPVNTAWMRVESVRTNSLAETLQLLELASTTAPYATALLDPSAHGLKVGRGLVRSARHAEVADLPESRQAEALRYEERIPAPPKSVSARLLDPRLAHRVHRVRYHTWPSSTIVDLQPVAEFFHLDDVSGKYPTLIGPRGMIRYSFSLPQVSGPHIASVLESIRATNSTFGRVSINQSNHASPSLLGANQPALAVNIDISHPAGSLTEVLDQCDNELVELGGQIALDSDSRLRREAVAAMFPRLGQWREAKAKADPNNVFASDLSRRLAL